ncbi:MAG TPA: F0F1 ATP synthase subunit A [Vicinamibacteria bacterium]|nr:F0F1 ATP synthase subunit A [Vicinamibacteria bacterium]
MPMTLWVLLAQAAHEPAAAHEGVEKAAEGAAEHAEGIADILMHHVVDHRYGDLYLFGLNVGPSKHLLWFAIAAALVLIVVRLANRSYKNPIPSGLGTAVETLVLYVRDEIAEKNIGHDGHKYVPLLLSCFFFILVAALLGLTPFSSTATGNLSVTLGLAFVSFLAMQWAGISKYGVVHHFQNMIPPGLPMWLLPIMIPVELLAMFTRPFALMIRLFANMLAGHMVIASLLLLIPLMASINVAFGVGMVPISLVLALFIMMLEILVAFIQAYIFTLLTSIFIGMNAHPAH